ncbi:formyltransferase family protein [Streptomyces sp. M10(2022)]
MLPKYRGPIPVNWAIRNGDKEIGVSIHWMESEFDSGGILAQEAGIALGDDVAPGCCGKRSTGTSSGFCPARSRWPKPVRPVHRRRRGRPPTRVDGTRVLADRLDRLQGGDPQPGARRQVRQLGKIRPGCRGG